MGCITKEISEWLGSFWNCFSLKLYCLEKCLLDPKKSQSLMKICQPLIILQAGSYQRKNLQYIFWKSRIVDFSTSTSKGADVWIFPSWIYQFGLWNIIAQLTSYHISAQPLHNHIIVSGHLYHFPCMKIYDTLRRHLCMLTYIYFDMDDCWLTYCMLQQMVKLKISLNYALIPENVISE